MSLDITDTTPKQELSAFLKWASNRIAKEVRMNERTLALENKQLEERVFNANNKINHKTSK
jgi:hypothetical protein